METIILDGKTLSKTIINQLKERVVALPVKPILAVIMVGDNVASKIYVNNKIKACARIGFGSKRIHLESDISEGALIQHINTLNADQDITGILVQLPLPKHIDPKNIIQAIHPLKDVDGFHFNNIGALSFGTPQLTSCTPKGIMTLLSHYNISIQGKHAVVIGRSNIVGKPLSMLLLKHNATVTTCHSKTNNLSDFTKNADIIVACTGVLNLVTADMVKQGVVVIDVGMNNTAEGKLCGDVDFEAVSKKASYITPVPGGVGPMTIASLMENCLQAYYLQQTHSPYVEKSI